MAIVRFSSDSESDEPSEWLFGLFDGKFWLLELRSGLLSSVELLLDRDTEYSDVLPSSDTFTSQFWLSGLERTERLPLGIGLLKILQQKITQISHAITKIIYMYCMQSLPDF